MKVLRNLLKTNNNYKHRGYISMLYLGTCHIPLRLLSAKILRHSAFVTLQGKVKMRVYMER